MPVYEYECKKCGESFELLVFGEKTITCPNAGQSRY